MWVTCHPQACHCKACGSTRPGLGHSLTPGAGGGSVSTEPHGLRVVVPKESQDAAPGEGTWVLPRQSHSQTLTHLPSESSVLPPSFTSSFPLRCPSPGPPGAFLPPLSSRLREATSIGDPARLPRPVLCLSSQRSVKPSLHPHFVITAGLPVHSMHEAGSPMLDRVLGEPL